MRHGTITLSNEVIDFLDKLKLPGESYDTLLRNRFGMEPAARICKYPVHNLEVGEWKQVPYLLGPDGTKDMSLAVKAIRQHGRNRGKKFRFDRLPEGVKVTRIE